MTLKLISILIFLPSLVFAEGKINFESRFDALGTTYNDAAKEAGVGYSNFKYYLKNARLDYSNNLNAKTFFRGRLVLNADQGAVNKRDSLNNSVDLFYVAYKFSDQFEFTGGKFNSDMGGQEHQYSSADVHMFTVANTGGLTGLDTNTKAVYLAKTGNTINTFTWANTGIVKYHTGVKASYKVPGHEFSVQSANLPADDTTATKYSQNRTLTGLVYKGSFAEKIFQPMLSYHETYLPGGTDDSKTTYTALGGKLTFGDHVIDADLLNNTFKSRTTASVGDTKDDVIASTSVAWSMTWESLTPKLKYENAQMTAANEKIYDVVGYGAAIEWKPVTEENFRFHAAYNSKTYKPSEGDSIIATEALVGLKIFADILK